MFDKNFKFDEDVTEDPLFLLFQSTLKSILDRENIFEKDLKLEKPIYMVYADIYELL